MAPERAAVTAEALGWSDARPISPAVRAGDLLFVSGQASLDENGELAYYGDVRAQAGCALERVRQVVEESGGKMDDILDLIAFFVDIRDADDVLDVARGFFSGDYPAWTFMGTQGLHRRGALVEMHAVAHLGDAKKHCFTTDSVAWLREYPVSGASRKGEYLFVSGMMPIDLDGNVINPGDHKAASRFIFDRLKELIGAAGGRFEEDLLDLLSFSIDPRSFDPMCIDVGCGEYLTMSLENAPSWTVIGSTALLKPRVVHTIRAMCEVGNGPTVAYTPETLFWSSLPVSGGTKKEHGHLLCVGGEVSMDRDGRIVSPGDSVAQARYAFERIREVVEMAGGTMDSVTDIISWHKDVRYIDEVLQVSREYFTGAPPAWSAVGYPGGHFEGHLHEIYARAWIP
jgi:2-iminobutanoate/2-iminopropanoate deaminase